jgi:hypothetical protein
MDFDNNLSTVHRGCYIVVNRTIVVRKIPANGNYRMTLCNAECDVICAVILTY